MADDRIWKKTASLDRKALMVKLLLAKLSRQVAAFTLTIAASSVMAIEEPSYQTLVNEPPFEHRRYSGFVVAETTLEGALMRQAGPAFGGLQATSLAITPYKLEAAKKSQ